MASTQVARAAAQLHEAALDVARVAAVRSTHPQDTTTEPVMPQQPGLAEDENDTDPGKADAAVPEEDLDT